MDDFEKIKYLKKLIDDKENQRFINIVNEIDNIEIDGAYYFQKIYLHACLKKNIEIATFLKNNIFPKLGEIEKISIRQCFAYGNYLLNK